MGILIFLMGCACEGVHGQAEEKSNGSVDITTFATAFFVLFCFLNVSFAVIIGLVPVSSTFVLWRR